VFIGSLTSNLRDQPPFRSVSSPARPPADRVFQEAQRARERGNRTEARRLFEQARDLDALRFRAPGEFNTIIRTVAGETGAHYVPIDEAFAAAAVDGIPGSELFWEHLHPNEKGYHLMGRVFFEALGRAGFLGRTVDTTRLRGWPAYLARMELTEFDQRFAWHQIQSVLASWPFVAREDPAGYPRNYHAASAADSAAFDVVILHGAAWPQAKFNLAAYYRSRGQLQLAFAEYRGLMRDQPDNATIPVYAADLFMQVSDFGPARELLERAYAMAPSAFTCFALGHLEVETKHPERAIRLLEQAQQLRADVPVVLYDLSRAYALSHDGPSARAWAERLEMVQPSFPGLDDWRAELAALPK
jgi:tetratricopeptide (TPR) repeat protein